MIKAVLWDFDGVIIDSMKIKGDGFKELFKNHNLADVKILEKYHYANGGVSRFDKIKYFYNKILNKDISEEKMLNLSDKFASIINKKIFNKDILVQDSLIFIEKNFIKYNFHIVSGAEHNELNSLCKFFKIDQYFKSINGSPTKKDILVQTVISNFKYNPTEVILIGDAITDYNAAKKNKIGFYGYNNKELKKFENYVEKFESIKL